MEDGDLTSLYEADLEYRLYEVACEEARAANVDPHKDPERFLHFLEEAFSLGVDEFDLEYDHLTDELAGIRSH